MVFVLRHVLHGEALILGLNRTYSLGRSRRNDIHLADLSVDKIHATLEITEAYADIEDKNSEHGTWVNKQKITQPFRLRNGDVIIFGKNNCKYVFLEPKFEAFIDKNISKPTQCMLAQTLKELNIILSKNYTRTCTHYVVEHVSFDTLKEKMMLYHLINRMTVITPKYFVDILANIKEAPLMPNIYRYMPEIDPQLKIKGIEDISPRKKRRHIFENMMFVFFDQEYDKNLTNLIFKCGGDTILYSQKQDFFEELFKDMNRYEYIAINHCENSRNPPQMSSFMKTMRQKRKKVSCASLADLYISVFKGDLVGVYREDLPKKTSPKEPQPSTSKQMDIINLDSSDDEEPGRVDIVCQIINTPKKTSTPINTFSRLAAAYKEQKTLKETVLESHVSAPTLNRWINRFKKKNTDEVQTVVNGASVCPDEVHQNISADDETQCDLEANVNVIHSPPDTSDAKSNKREQRQDAKHNGNGQHEMNMKEEINSRKNTRKKEDTYSAKSGSKRKQNNTLGQQETQQETNDNNNKPGDSNLYNKHMVSSIDSKNNKKRKSVVINPCAVNSPLKRAVPEKQNASPSNLDFWIKKYKNADIIPMT